ncbi:MAG TPA: glycosyltransferase family 4 protein [Gemmatirosa sp.]|nr:glycosyltransferase family 4 protein [Gemmatirosa sp.]
MVSPISPPPPHDALRTIQITPWYGGNLGGVAVITADLVGTLAESGVPSAVVTLGEGVRPQAATGTFGEAVWTIGPTERSHVPPRLRSHVGYWTRRLLARRAFDRLMRTTGARIAHFHYATEEYPWLMDLAHARGLRVVTTYHGSDLMEAADADPTLALARAMLARSDAVTVVSQALARCHDAHFPERAGRATVIPNPVTRSVWSQVHRLAAEPPRRDIDILFIGTFFPYKGPDLFVRTFAHVAASAPDVRATMVSDGPMRVPLEAEVARLGLADRVRFEGHVARERIPEYLSRARLLMVSSRVEGLPLVITEAMACGTPVVGFRVGGVAEAVVDGETGLIVDPEDVEALAAAARRLLDDEPLRARFGAAARARAALFDPAAAAARYTDVYRALLHRSA